MTEEKTTTKRKAESEASGAPVAKKTKTETKSDKVWDVKAIASRKAGECHDVVHCGAKCEREWDDNQRCCICADKGITCPSCRDPMCQTILDCNRGECPNCAADSYAWKRAGLSKNAEGYCHRCKKVLVAIGHARKNGKDHADWDTRKYHKKCWREQRAYEEWCDRDDSE